ncbi:glycoside hydrolase family 28 protein [Formosa sp. A9]|uniref:glycoside hydrolase family 28 protein n=1 Tax=Formosa sp. A9 TaxID=3442641 RepID=UPI003EBFA99A
MKRISIPIAIAYMAVCSLTLTNCSESASKTSEAESITKQSVVATNAVEFNMPDVNAPNIPDFKVKLTDYGAVGDGVTLNTEAFKAAIAAVSEKGGGTVVIPPGIWLTGPIILESKLELHAESGALIKFSADKNLYPIIETSFEGLDTWRCISPIYGKHVEDVAFTGEGIWDGSGDAWRHVKRDKLTANQWKKKVASGGYVHEDRIWYPSKTYRLAEEGAELNVRKDLTSKEDFEAIKVFLRPVMVSIQNSKRVLFDGPVFQNSAAWNIHPLMVEDLIVRNITVRNPWYSQNGDGLDVESCKNVIVEHSSFDVGDDAICVKSGKDEDGRNRAVSTENIIIRNNVVYHGHGGVTVGSEMSGGVKNMHVSNCMFIGTDVGLRFKSKRGRGGVVENVFISDIRMIDIPTNAISFNLYYGGLSVSEMMEKGGMQASTEAIPVTEETPQFKNISIKDVTINGAKQAVFLQGLPEMNLEHIAIENMQIVADNGFTIIDAADVKIKNIHLEVNQSNAFTIFNTKDLELDTTSFNTDSQEAIKIGGSGNANIVLKAKEGQDLSAVTQLNNEVANDAVSFK